MQAPADEGIIFFAQPKIKQSRTGVEKGGKEKYKRYSRARQHIEHMIDQQKTSTQPPNNNVKT